MPESIGQKLKAARESRRLSLEKAADATRIRAPYLQALENDDYSVMVSAAQGRGFLRIYAEFLGLSLDELTASARDNKPVASPVLEADSTSLAVPAPEATAAVSAEKSSRPGFWSRLLRRAPKEEVVPSAEEASSEPAPVTVVEEPSAVTALAEAEESVLPAKKNTRKKSASSEEKPTSARKAAAGKKKRTLSLPSKN